MPEDYEVGFEKILNTVLGIYRTPLCCYGKLIRSDQVIYVVCGSEQVIPQKRWRTTTIYIYRVWTTLRLLRDEPKTMKDIVQDYSTP